MTLPALFLLATAQAAPAPPPLDPAQQKAVVSWVKKAAIPLRSVKAESGLRDLMPVKRIVGKARIVSLGEATHGTREIFQMKHRMLEFLVKEMDFTVFGIEASYPDCLAINDYVLHGKGDLNEVVSGNGFWTWDTEEVMDMVEWMRKYNADPKHKTKIKFYGFDMQNATPATKIALAALAKADPALVADIAPKLRYLTEGSAYVTYPKTPLAERQEGRRMLQSVLAAFDAQREKLTAALGKDGYLDARQSAVVALQAEEGLAQMAEQPTAPFTDEHRSLLGRIEASVATATSVVPKLPEGEREKAEAMLARLKDLNKLYEEYYTKATEADRKAWKDAAAALAAVPDAGNAKPALDDVIAIFPYLDTFAPRRIVNDNWRDKCMAENIAWILEREGPKTKIVTWAHNGHATFANPARRAWWMMGRYLDERFGSDHLAIGFSVNRGTLQAIYSPAPAGSSYRGPQGFYFQPAKPGSLDHTLAQAGIPMFLLDVRRGNGDRLVESWLDTAWPMRSVGAIYSPDHDARWLRPTALRKSFHAIIYLDETTRAIPSPLRRQRSGLTDLKPVNPKPN